MFAGGYFPAVYFADSYFPRPVSLSDAPYFPVGAFAPRYFADRYFPHGSAPVVTAVKPSYFYHGVFPIRFFPDRYFPGEFAHVVTPPTEPPVFVGGGRFRPQPFPREVIHALVRLVLPVPRVRIRAEYIPPTVAASVRVDIPPVLLESLRAAASPAEIRAALQAVALWVDIHPIWVEVFRPRNSNAKRSLEQELEEEQLLLEHYMLSLKDYQ